jgi:ATP-binding cassette subfamily B protein
MSKPSFPTLRQPDAMDCGSTCLQMIARWYGKSYTLPMLRERCYITRTGVSMLGISDAAESIGFRSMGVECIRTWILLHVRTCSNILLITNLY